VSDKVNSSSNMSVRTWRKVYCGLVDALKVVLSSRLHGFFTLTTLNGHLNDSIIPQTRVLAYLNLHGRAVDLLHAPEMVEWSGIAGG
jgi:hypothetical protein